MKLKRIIVLSVVIASLLLSVASITAQSIKYNPNSAAFVVDAEVVRVLNHFPTRPTLWVNREYGDGAQRLVLYQAPNESNRLEIRFPDLTEDSEAHRLIAHQRAVELLEALAPRYFGQAANLVEVKDGEFIYKFR